MTRATPPKFNNLISFVLVVGTILLISLLYPRGVKFKYEFQKGQPWQYENLRAPFDFAIKKQPEELAEEQRDLIRGFSPYYRLNQEIGSAKMKDFEAAFDLFVNSLRPPADTLPGGTEPKVFLIKGIEILRKLYDRGIYLLAPQHIGRDKDFVINVIEGNTTYMRTLPSYLSLEQAKKTALEELLKFAPYTSPTLRQIMDEAVVANLTFDEDFTEKVKQEALSGMVTTKGLVRQGDLIVQKRAVVTDEVYEQLVSLRDKFQDETFSKDSSLAVYCGYLLLTILVLGSFMMYVQAYRREIIENWRFLAFVLTWLLAFSYLTKIVEQIDALSVYVIPYCIVPVVVRHFFTYRLAFFTHVMVVLITVFLTSLGYQFIFMQIVAGVIAVLVIADARDWTKFFRSVLFVFLAYALAYLGLSLIEEGGLENMDTTVFNWLLFNGLLTLMAFPLIPLVERAFGFTSSISLVELSDVNRPLLRELAIKAPGTMQHTIQVANLAEAAAAEIKADPLLVRVGTLYHDIGKMKNPEYFVENQTGTSPHDRIDQKESARIIIEHVKAGEKMARKAHLPPVISRFITTHHGTTKVEYFYKTYLQENPGVAIEESDFAYPGPKPRSKEEAILMLADSVEATSRALKDPTGQEIDELVDKILKKKFDQNQLDESKLTFADLEKCRAVFKKMLRSIHHVRIEYPE